MIVYTPMYTVLETRLEGSSSLTNVIMSLQLSKLPICTFSEHLEALCTTSLLGSQEPEIPAL